MMQTLRKKTKYVLFIALAGFAALIFFQWGANITGVAERRETDIAKIDGVPVPYTDYLRFISLKENEHKGISREDIWDLMVEEIMWGNLIRQEKIHVSDEEVWAVIRSNPPREIYESEYMKDDSGEFDFNKYYELLRAPQSRSWRLEYEYNIRQQIPKEKIRSLISSFGWMSPYEDSLTIAGMTVKYDIAYLSIPLFRARYLLEISDEELQEYYDNNPDEFTTPELKILKFVFFEKKASHYDTLEAKERIEDFIDRIKEGEDFLEVAKEVTDDTIVVRNFESDAELEPYLKNVYRELKNGEMSEIMQALHGYEVIKRIRKGMIYRVQVNIEVSSTTIGEIYDKIMSFKETVQEYDFDSASVDFDLSVRRTYPLNSDNVTFPVRNTEGLAKFLSKAKMGEIAGPFSSLGGYYLFTLDSIIPKTYLKFEEVKPKIRAEIERKKLTGVIENQLNQVYDQLVTGKTLEEITSEDTIMILRNREDATLGQLQRALGGEVAGVVARLDSGQFSRPLVMDWAGYIIRCDRKIVSPFDSTMLMSLQMKRQMRLQELTVNIFTPKKIEDKRDLFFE